MLSAQNHEETSRYRIVVAMVDYLLLPQSAPHDLRFEGAVKFFLGGEFDVKNSRCGRQRDGTDPKRVHEMWQRSLFSLESMMRIGRMQKRGTQESLFCTIDMSSPRGRWGS